MKYYVGHMQSVDDVSGKTAYEQNCHPRYKRSIICHHYSNSIESAMDRTIWTWIRQKIWTDSCYEEKYKTHVFEFVLGIRVVKFYR